MIMEEEFDGSITIPLIAERLHISVNHLQTQFKKEMNTTIRQYLTEVRMQQACRLLLQTNDKVSDVGWQVGYKDTDHFVHVFREATGYTPNEYRKSDK